MTVEESLQNYLNELSDLDWYLQSHKDHNKVRFICFTGAFRGQTGWIDQTKDNWYTKAKNELYLILIQYRKTL